MAGYSGIPQRTGIKSAGTVLVGPSQGCAPFSYDRPVIVEWAKVHYGSPVVSQRTTPAAWSRLHLSITLPDGDIGPARGAWPCELTGDGGRQSSALSLERREDRQTVFSGMPSKFTRTIIRDHPNNGRLVPAQTWMGARRPIGLRAAVLGAGL